MSSPMQKFVTKQGIFVMNPEHFSEQLPEEKIESTKSLERTQAGPTCKVQSRVISSTHAGFCYLPGSESWNCGEKTNNK